MSKTVSSLGSTQSSLADTRQGKGGARSILRGDGYGLVEAFKKLRSTPDLTFYVENTAKDWFGARLEVDAAEGTGHWEFCQFADDFYVIISDLMYAEPRTEFLPGDGLLEFHIKLSGHLTMMTSRTDPVEVDGPSLLVWAQPEGLEADEKLGAEQETSVTLYLKPAYIFENLVHSSEQIPVHLARFVLNEANSINYCQLAITSEILDAATALLQSTTRFKDLLWLNYIHAKGEELICDIVAAFDQLASAEQESFNKLEIQQLREAKKIVSEEFAPSPTIKQIAKTIGTNETKLKYGFKALFGETIFAYRNRRRMKKAIQLIEQDVAIGRVSEEVGYQHQTSFTSAFKSYYGISPKDYRKLAK